MIKRYWTIWKYTIGSFSDDKTEKYDNAVAVLRTVVLLVNLACAILIIANIIHNWK